MNPPVLRPARPEDAAGIARVNGDAWRAAYRGIFPDAVLEARGREPDAVERRRRWMATPGTAAFVAEVEGEVVGFAFAGAPREPVPGFDAELHALYVHPGRQGQGLGRRLLFAAAAAVEATGRRSWFLWTLRDNRPTRDFYESLGGRVVADRTALVEGIPVAEVAYGWDSLHDLFVPPGAPPPAPRERDGGRFPASGVRNPPASRL